MKRTCTLLILLTIAVLLLSASCDLKLPDVTTTGTETEPSPSPEGETYPITVKIQGNGAATFNGDAVTDSLTKELSLSDHAVVTATPAEGYTFKGWYEETDGGLTLLYDESEATYTVPARPAVIVAVFEMQTYPITVRVEGVGTVTCNGEIANESFTRMLTVEDALRLVATPEKGYVFKGWYEETPEGLLALTEENSVTFTVPARETVIVGVFERVYSLYVYAEDDSMGWFIYNGEEEIELDLTASGETTVELAATPEEGYLFDGWYALGEDGTETLYSSEATLSLTYGINNLTLICRFVRRTEYTGTVYIVGEGQVVVNNEKRENGDQMILKAEAPMTCVVYPANGYFFKGWYERAEDGTETFLTDMTEITFVMPYRDSTVVAVFEEQDILTVTVQDPSTGWFTVAGVSGTFTAYEAEGKGTKVTLTAVPAEGYEFHYWGMKGTNSLLSIEPTCEVTINWNLEIEAVFRPKLDLTISVTAGGSVSVNGGAPVSRYTGKIASYDEFTVKLIPDEGYVLQGLYTSDAQGNPARFISSNLSQTLYMPETAYSLVAVFEPIFKGYVTSITSTPAGGYFAVEGFADTYTAFEDIHPTSRAYTVTATPASDHAFAGWYLVSAEGETLISSDLTCTFTQPNADTTVIAKFRKTYPVYILTEGDGTVIVNGEAVNGQLDLALSVEDVISLKAISSPQSRFVGWYEQINGEADKWLTDDPEVILTVPARSCIIIAVFESNAAFTVSTEGIDEACIRLNDDKAYIDHYSDRFFMPYHFTLTAVTPEGYAFEGWYAIREGGQRTLLSVDDSYIGVMNDGDLHIVASFTKVCSVTVSIMGGGQVTNDADGRTYDEAFNLTVAKGDTFTLSIPWSDEWALDGWYPVDEDGKLGHRFSVDSLECEFTATEDMHICAVFVPKYDLTIITENDLGGFTVNWSEEVYTNWGASAAGPHTYTVTAIAPVGYVFAGWYEVMGGDIEDMLLSESVTYSVTVDGNDRVILPRFTKAEDVLFTLYVKDYVGASFLCNGEEIPGDGWEWNVPYGSTMTVTVILEEGYTFEGWYIEYFDEEYQTYFAFYSDELTVSYTCVEEYCTLVAFVKGCPVVEGDIPPVIN